VPLVARLVTEKLALKVNIVLSTECKYSALAIDNFAALKHFQHL
jgi:hypothetical protein